MENEDLLNEVRTVVIYLGEDYELLTDGGKQSYDTLVRLLNVNDYL